MSLDEQRLLAVVEAAWQEKLEFVLIGNVAAVLQDVPVMTEDIDLFVRETPLNLKKIKALAARLGGVLSQPYEPVSTMLRVTTPTLTVDLVFALSSRRKFESVRARALRLKLGNRRVLVASLEDVIAAKEAADRPKDRATLGILKQTLEVKKKLAEELGKE
jgi:predicted nucleotidyltransferase